MLDRRLDRMAVRTRGAVDGPFLALAWLAPWGPVIGILFAMAQLGEAPVWGWARGGLPVLAAAWALTGLVGVGVLLSRLRRRELAVDPRGWRVEGRRVPGEAVDTVTFLHGRLTVRRRDGGVVRSAPLPEAAHPDVVALVHAWQARHPPVPDEGATDAMPAALKALVGRAAERSSG